VSRPQLVEVTQPSRSPLLGALARLGSESSRRTVYSRAQLAADVLSGGKLGALELPWEQVSPDALAALRVWLIENRAPATGRAMVSAVQSILRQAWRDGMISAERLERLRDLPPIRGSDPPRGRMLKPSEIKALFEACENTRSGKRDRVILALLFGCGLRRSEVVSLELGDVTVDGLVVRRSKGGKSRMVPMPPAVRGEIDAWVSLRGPAPGALACRVSRVGRVDPKHMSGNALSERLVRLVDASGVAPFTSHDGRRTAITNLLADGAPLHLVARFAGHSQVSTTAAYCRDEDEALELLVARVGLPGL